MGRLVTVAGVGSSRCLLFSGVPGEAPLPLTDDHVIHTHLRERQRLLSVSCTASPGGSAVCIGQLHSMRCRWQSGPVRLRPHLHNVCLPPLHRRPAGKWRRWM